MKRSYHEEAHQETTLALMDLDCSEQDIKLGNQDLYYSQLSSNGAPDLELTLAAPRTMGQRKSSPSLLLNGAISVI